MNSFDYIYEKKSLIRLTNNQLKIIAMLTMLIDHIGVMLILNGKLYGYDIQLYSYVSVLNSASKWMILYRVCRVIGRISFPLFAFCIVEGFIRTSNLLKYVLRLLVLAIVSEIPFNLMVNNSLFYIGSQNVIWTYLIGIIVLFLIKKANGIVVIQMIIFMSGCLVSFFAKTDYDYYGILLITFYYLTRTDRRLRTFGNMIITGAKSLPVDYGSAALSSIFIHCYDGTKGILNLKKIFYWFYPVHMLVLYLIVFFSYRI